MAITFTTRVIDDMLLVEASGFDESVEEVQAYGMAIVRAGLAHGVKRILCNELHLEYRLSTIDTYLAAEFIALHAPHIARIAIVTSAQCASDARFWEDVVVNRGLSARVFTDLQAAREWLNANAATGNK